MKMHDSEHHINTSASFTHDELTVIFYKIIEGKLMESFWHQAISVLLAFFAIMNPIPNTVAFVGLTHAQTSKARKNTAFRALLISFVIIVIFALLGKTIFHLFGITLQALRITGGIIVFIIGYQMLKGTGNHVHESDNNPDTDISVSPLAVPLLAGPGTIATAMNYSAATGWSMILTTIISFGILCIISFFCFISGQTLIKNIGENGLNIISRLMGLILAVIGCQMIIQGVSEVVTHLKM